MNQAAQESPLSQLRDIHTPDAISAWPPAMGWWLLALISLVVLWLLFVKVRHYLQRRRHDYRRLALKECAVLEKQLAQAATDAKAQQAILMEANALLKQTAMAAYSREAVAKRSGEGWLLFLQAQLPASSQPGWLESIAGLQQVVYQNETLSTADAQAVLRAVHQWVNLHQLPMKAVMPSDMELHPPQTQKERA